MKNTMERLKELSDTLNSFNPEKVKDDMNELVQKLSSSGKEEDIAELQRIQDNFENLSRNLLNLADFIEKRFKS